MGSRLLVAGISLLTAFMAASIARHGQGTRRRGKETGPAGVIVEKQRPGLVRRAILGISATLFAAACLGDGSVAHARLGSSGAAEEDVLSSLLGVWVQDDVGPVLTYRRASDFRPDGSYGFVFTVRNTGAMDQAILVQEEGKFAIEGDLLVISSQFRPDGAFPWRTDQDPYVGDVRLVMILPDGTWDVFFRP